MRRKTIIYAIIILFLMLGVNHLINSYSIEGLKGGAGYASGLASSNSNKNSGALLAFSTIGILFMFMIKVVMLKMKETPVSS